MSVGRDELYLEHITETIALIDQTRPASASELAANPNLRDATLYRLQTLAESASLLSDEAKGRYPEIQWPAIAGFRNRLVHGYTTVRIERVWQVIEDSLGPLRQMAETELRRLRMERGRERGLDIGR